LGGGAGGCFEFYNLSRGGTCDSKRFAFGGELSDEANGLRASGIHAAASKEQVANETVAEGALESRDAAKARNKAEAPSGKREAGPFVRDDDVANERELQPAAETDTVNCCNRDEWCFVEPIENGVDMLQKIADTFSAYFRLQLDRALVKLAQIGSRAE